MSERVLPDGQVFINMKGDIKAVAKHLAFDRSNQKQMGYFPCDANGIAIAQPTEEEVANTPKKKEVAATDAIRDYPEAELNIKIPAQRTEIVNPLEEEANGAKDNTAEDLTEIDSEAAKIDIETADNTAAENTEQEPEKKEVAVTKAPAKKGAKGKPGPKPKTK